MITDVEHDTIARWAICRNYAYSFFCMPDLSQYVKSLVSIVQYRKDHKYKTHKIGSRLFMYETRNNIVKMGNRKLMQRLKVEMQCCWSSTMVLKSVRRHLHELKAFKSLGAVTSRHTFKPTRLKMLSILQSRSWCISTTVPWVFLASWSPAWLHLENTALLQWPAES